MSTTLWWKYSSSSNITTLALPSRLIEAYTVRTSWQRPQLKASNKVLTPFVSFFFFSFSFFYVPTASVHSEDVLNLSEKHTTWEVPFFSFSIQASGISHPHCCQRLTLWQLCGTLDLEKGSDIAYNFCHSLDLLIILKIYQSEQYLFNFMIPHCAKCIPNVRSPSVFHWIKPGVHNHSFLIKST